MSSFRKIINSSLIIFCIVSFCTGSVFAGTYIYYNEKGEKVLYLPKKSKPEVKNKDKKRVSKGTPAGIPFQHKDKTTKRPPK